MAPFLGAPNTVDSFHTIIFIPDPGSDIAHTSTISADDWMVELD